MMELLRPQQVVEFEGLTLVVPHDTAYLTIDCEGSVVAHGSLPWTEVGFWESLEELGIVACVSPEFGTQWFYSNEPFKLEIK